MIRIDLESPVPIEEQVAQEIRRAIARQEVVAGDPLPSVRQLADDLGIHWNTVARAYRRLRDEGLLIVGRGRGVLVKGTAAVTSKPRRELTERIQRILRDAITEARLAGFDREDFSELVDKELRNWRKDGQRS
ncbi:MAG: GntR family transcriptional regulator [Candidatus Hydrogenedentes bacterium]|nr:GntR family transcriptional regulator [Candidatus Hydrogenedentota bacterium]